MPPTRGPAAFTLTVNGTGFVNGATVRWNGNNRTTAFVGATQLTAQIPASDLLTLGPATVTVFNPSSSAGGGGGGTSNAQSFNVMANVASLSAASFSGAELAADSIVAAFGSELATQTLAAPVTPLPTTLTRRPCGYATAPASNGPPRCSLSRRGKSTACCRRGRRRARRR
ncbi:MAG: IPT/TIG domain-containing protein [Acidobacteria bacterium]|nr:IPT/TIG domain-containing protein [Acidobacteriota bacterium]